MGYANELGESFRYVTPWLVKPSYAVAFGYVFADTYDKAKKQYVQDGMRMSNRLYLKSADCLIWQTLASVLVPGWVIHKIVKYTRVASLKIKNQTGFVKLIPTFMGLASIPFIIHPIDNSIDYLMDNSFRTIKID